MGNRKKAEALILKYVKLLEGGVHNYNLYKALFERLNDKAFEDFIKGLEAGDYYVSLIIPNGSDKLLNMENVLKVGESLGVKYFQRVLTTDAITHEVTMSNLEYLVVDLPVRRQSQHLIKKRSIPEGAKVIDALTGQVTGVDKGAKQSLPEILALNSRGFSESLIEMIKVRGGDLEAYAEMRRMMSEQGDYSLAPILEKDTEVISTETLRSYLFALHFENTI